MSVVLQMQESGARRAPQQQHGTRGTWRHFARTTWVHLAVALAIFVSGIGIAMHLFVVVGRWQGPQHAAPFPAQPCQSSPPDCESSVCVWNKELVLMWGRVVRAGSVPWVLDSIVGALAA